MHKTLVINAVGLTRALLARMPRARRLGTPATIGHVTPAVTCSVQATYLTGTLPREHGIVGNGWYFRDECEVRFWHQSDKLVQRPRIWDLARAREPSFTCANIGWWHAMYSGADVTVTPRPMYPADGRKIPDIWTNPPELRQSLQAELGQFPLFRFWGPATSIDSSAWLADAAIWVDRQLSPTLTLVYLPHLDYILQRQGPDSAAVAADLDQLDAVIGRLFDHFLNKSKARVVLLSEYGIEPAASPIHINRLLREAGLLSVRAELGRELLDAGASTAFSVADHQLAHVYVNDRNRDGEVRAALARDPGIVVLDKHAAGLDHPRSGDIVAMAAPGHWFTYYYWLDDTRAPDFARTVDIHRKPGYDPVELFIDPQIRWPAARIGWTLFKRRLGLRSLLGVIPLDATLVHGSHGRPPASTDAAPIFLSTTGAEDPPSTIAPTDICRRLLAIAGAD